MIDLSYRDIQGNLKEKQETANSYVISKPGEYCFPLIMGNGVKDGKTNYLAFTNQKLSEKQADFYDYLDRIITSPELIGGKSVSIISWDSSREFIKSLEVDKDYIKFLITNVPEDGANYIIGVKDSNGIVMWSWHIWLWKKKLEDIEIGKYKILNTNLASKKLNNKLVNCLYQWGRKDPIMTYTKIIRNLPKFGLLGNSIQNPGNFYIKPNREGVYTWIKLRNFINYWNINNKEAKKNTKVEKTIYDPCPFGYTIPRRNLFYNFCRKYPKKFRALNDNYFGTIDSSISFNSLPSKYNINRWDKELENVGNYWTSGLEKTIDDIIYYPSGLKFIAPNYYDYYNYFDSACLCSVRPQLEEI